MSGLLWVSLFAGCVLSAMDQAPVTYPFSELRRIAVLPVIDSRGDQKQKINAYGIQKDVMKILSKRRYQAVAGDRGTDVLRGLTEDDFKKAGADLIKKIGPQNERWALVVCATDVESKLTFGSSAHARIMIFLLDKERGRVAWSDIGTGHASMYGLDGMMFKRAMKSNAIRQSVYKMLEAFPKLPKVK